MFTNLPRADKGLLLLLPPCDVVGDASSATAERPDCRKTKSKSCNHIKAEDIKQRETQDANILQMT